MLFTPGGDLLTYNDRGLCRWPVRQIDERALRVGPAEPLALIVNRPYLVNSGLASSADGRFIGVASFFRRGSLLLDRDRPWRRTLLTPHRGASDLAISPDGRWACSGSRGETPERAKVKVWDVASGLFSVELPVGNARVAFSPDSRWLGVGGKDRYRFFKTGNWEAGPEIEHSEGSDDVPLAFHPSSRLVALLDSSRSFVRIADLESGSVVAALHAPDPSTIHSLVFSPDGRYLAVAKTDQRVDLWDLLSIHERLLSLRLAGGLPNLFDGGAVSPLPIPIARIEVHGADPAGLRVLAARNTLRFGFQNFLLFLETGLSDPEELAQRGNRWNRLGHWKQAVADYRASLARRADSAETANELAWALVAFPGRGDTQEALAWARKAVEIDPDSAPYHNTLGVALYRASRFVEAAEELERNVPRNTEESGFDLVFLSMCRQRLGQTKEAQSALALARLWQAKAPPMPPAGAANFEAFIREAESLLTGTIPE